MKLPTGFVYHDASKQTEAETVKLAKAVPEKS